jgi:hypothetical protein
MNIEDAIKQLEVDLEVTERCIPECGIQKELRNQIEILTKAMDIIESLNYEDQSKT